MIKEVMQTVQTFAVPQKITKQLHDQFRLQLVGLTKRLEFVLRVRSDEVERVLGVVEDVQKILAEVVPPSRRSQLTWSRLARQPVQCEEDVLSREASRMLENLPHLHALNSKRMCRPNQPCLLNRKRIWRPRISHPRAANLCAALHLELQKRTTLLAVPHHH
jgi:hypothetical protein